MTLDQHNLQKSDKKCAYISCRLHFLTVLPVSLISLILALRRWCCVGWEMNKALHLHR